MVAGDLRDPAKFNVLLTKLAMNHRRMFGFDVNIKLEMERCVPKTNLGTVCTHKHRHPPAPCEKGFLPENVACLSVLGQKN
jgi:hypothetical protein